jgi:hypothetical protein
MSQFESTDAIGDCACERTFAVAEKFTFE